MYQPVNRYSWRETNRGDCTENRPFLAPAFPAGKLSRLAVHSILICLWFESSIMLPASQVSLLPASKLCFSLFNTCSTRVRSRVHILARVSMSIEIEWRSKTARREHILLQSRLPYRRKWYRSQCVTPVAQHRLEYSSVS